MKIIQEIEKYESPKLRIDEIMLDRQFCDGNLEDVSGIGNKDFEGCDNDAC